MKRIINFIERKLKRWCDERFDLKSKEEFEGVKEMMRAYYQKVVNELARTGTLPPNCDLKIPKQNMTILVMDETDDNVKGEVIAKDGRWLRLPNDREKVIIRYI